MDIASRVGTDSVGDPDLLGHAGLHDNIADFARITQYLTPAATAYLTLYCHDAFRDPANRGRVAGLVLVAYQSGKAAADATKGAFLRPPPFDAPFTVQRTTVTVDPKVGVSSNGRMVVSGTASAQIPATKNRVHYVDTSTERFTYYIAGTASQAARVGIDGWYGYPNVTWTPR